MKTLYLHVGHYKTGTSAIQKYCSENAAMLAENGYFYSATARPHANPTNHGDLSLTIAAKHGFVPPAWYKERKDIDKVYGEFLEDCRQAAQQNILVSSEEFVQLALRTASDAALHELRERFAEFDVRIVLYIREPIALLKSWYGEVNKGPSGTRPFPVFFMNLDPNFLSQNMVYGRLAEVFGADKVIVRSYKSVGMDHIRDFLSGIGYSPLPEGDSWSVNEGQDIKLLELSRLAKQRDNTHEEATLSRIADMGRMEAKVASINAGFAMVSQISDVPLASELSLANIYRHHRSLITPLIELGCANKEEAAVLRDAALTVEKTNLELARVLMQTAQQLRPGGPFIRGKLQDYDRKLHGAEKPAA